jgi:predicted porin
VSITGLIDTGYAIVNGAATNGDIKGLRANNTGTTVLTLAGTEDLGAGLAANFQLQLTPDFLSGNGVQGGTANNTAGDGTYTTAIGNGQQAFVGLSSKTAGSIKLGRVNSNALDAWGVGSVFGTALGSGYGSNGNILTRYSTSSVVSAYQSAPTRFNNSIRYESPAFSGFSGSVLYVPKNNVAGGTETADTTAAKSTNRQGVTEFGLKYTQGALNVAYANQKIAAGALGTTALVSNTGATALEANTSNKLSILSANYTIGATTVYAASFSEKQDTATAVETSGRMFGAKHTMGAITLMASMGSSNEKSAANVDKKITGIGADYALSKRTNAYVRYENRDADKNVATDATASGITKVTAIGVRHTF